MWFVNKGAKALPQSDFKITSRDVDVTVHTHTFIPNQWGTLPLHQVLNESAQF